MMPSTLLDVTYQLGAYPKGCGDVFLGSMPLRKKESYAFNIEVRENPSGSSPTLIHIRDVVPLSSKNQMGRIRTKTIVARMTDTHPVVRVVIGNWANEEFVRNLMGIPHLPLKTHSTIPVLRAPCPHPAVPQGLAIRMNRPILAYTREKSATERAQTSTRRSTSKHFSTPTARYGLNRLSGERHNPQPYHLN